jgi:SAM-dependent methyltransferase
VSRHHEATDWYDTPLYYDIVFAVDDAKEGAFLAECARLHGRTRSGRRKLRALEPACGSGRLVLELAKRGFAVTGFDGSDSMLAFARERLRAADRSARLMRARLESFDVGRGFDLAHCLVSTFKYLLDEAGAHSHLRSVARALAPGGIYVLGIHLTDYADRRRNRERWVARRGGTRVVRLRVQERGVERRTETEWPFRTYDWPQFRRTLAAVPELEHVASYDFAYDLERPRRLPDGQLDTVFVLRKRAATERRSRASRA